MSMEELSYQMPDASKDASCDLVSAVTETSSLTTKSGNKARNVAKLGYAPGKRTQGRQQATRTSAYRLGPASSNCSSRGGGYSSMSSELNADLDHVEKHHHTFEGNRVARKARFMCNGDEHFAGVIVVISPQRTRTFESLLTELTRLMQSSLALPQGVRHVFTVFGESIHSLDDFEDGEVYVCSSNATFRHLDYTGISKRLLEGKKPMITGGRSQMIGNRGSAFGSPSQGCLPAGGKSYGFGKSPYSPHPAPLPIDHSAAKPFVHPRFVFIVRNGISRPRQIFRILLNRKTAISLDQVLNTISSEISLDSGAVRKLFTLGGEKVKILEDFFGEHDVFLAYGQERHYDEDFYLTPSEADHLKNLGAQLTMTSNEEEGDEEDYSNNQLNDEELLDDPETEGHEAYEAEEDSSLAEKSGPGGDAIPAVKGGPAKTGKREVAAAGRA